MHSVEIKIDQIGARTEDQGRQNYGRGKRVGITTLGCKVNSFESELIAEMLKTDQWHVVPNTDVADLYVINTCTVTREADRS